MKDQMETAQILEKMQQLQEQICDVLTHYKVGHDLKIIVPQKKKTTSPAQQN